MMLDSGSSVSFRKDVLSEVSGVCAAASKGLRLVTAAGEPTIFPQMCNKYGRDHLRRKGNWKLSWL